MRKGRLLCCVGMALGLAGALLGCATPQPQSVLADLSYLILVPERTCEELRAAFQLDGFPVVDYPDQLGLPYEEQYVPNGLGATLRVWYIPAEQDRGTVILSPGSVASMPCYLYTPLLLNQRGWSVVMYEYQGFGKSTGIPSLTSLRFDLEAVLDWTRTRTARSQVTLYGISLGSVPSIAVGIDRADQVNGVIVDSPVAFGEEFKRVDVLLGLYLETTVRLVDPSLITEDVISQLTRPMLMLVNDADEVTPPALSQLLFDRAAGPKEIVHFTGDHASAQFLDTTDYMDHVEAFLENAWSAGAAQ